MSEMRPTTSEGIDRCCAKFETRWNDNCDIRNCATSYKKVNKAIYKSFEGFDVISG